MGLQLISKENARELKSIGFDVPCFFFYHDQETVASFASKNQINHNLSRLHCSAPDILSVCDWFYEKHEIEFTLKPKKKTIVESNVKDDSHCVSEIKATFDSSDEAIQSAIKLVKDGFDFNKWVETISKPD